MGDEVKRVMSATTYYDIFGLKFGQFDELVVRKEYRKLAIKLHPDTFALGTLQRSRNL